jgi:competence ComEA-like helix-hairpin-helix protein
MRFRKALLSLALCPASILSQTVLPDAPGKDATQKICANCHEIDTVVSSRRTRIGWQRMVDEMISRGAEGSEDEMAAVVAYLTAAFGKINVNTASSTELQKILGISDKEAVAITKYRDQNGKYKNFEELEKTPGIVPEKLREKRTLIAFSQ